MDPRWDTDYSQPTFLGAYLVTPDCSPSLCSILGPTALVTLLGTNPAHLYKSRLPHSGWYF